jgi:hypothetical protein
VSYEPDRASSGEIEIEIEIEVEPEPEQWLVADAVVKE